MIKSIMVAVDGSAYDTAAREQAIAMAKAYGARLEGVNVVDVRLLETPPFLSSSFPVETISSPDPVEMLEAFRVNGERALDDFALAVTQAGLQVGLSLEEGVPAQVIADVADSHDLLVMGKRGEGAKWSKDLLGSVTEEVLRRACTPVLLTEKQAGAFRSILVLFDGGHLAHDALKLAADVASHLGASLTVFTAADSVKEAEAIQAQARAYLEPFDIPVDYRIRVGEAGTAVADELDDELRDLVVMGKHGHSRLHDLILGSTTQRLTHQVPVPLLMVP